MPILTDAQRATLAARLALPDCVGLTDAAAADVLNTPSVAGPTPPPVPAPFTASDGLDLIGPPNLAKIIDLPAFTSDIRPLLDADPKTARTVLDLDEWAGALFKAGDLAQSEYDALAAPAPGTTPGAPVGLFNRTVPDPTPPPPVSWWRATFGDALVAGLTGQCPVAAVTEARST